MIMSTAAWLGRIQRKILWPVLGSEEFPELRLIDERTRVEFASAISSGRIHAAAHDPSRIAIRRLTAGAYLHYVRICYEGAFGKAEGQTDIDLYRAFSDGRHGGLIHLPANDPKAFSRWYETEAFRGTHPFEIVRDANVLFAHRLPAPPRDYFLRLANRRRERVDPYLIRMAIALNEAGVPFYLEIRATVRTRILDPLDPEGLHAE